ncbi:MAG: hypothetical protein HYY93_04475, partial [Planctomycetes bacterium]|nr:hypothetical protein [Planctomycetota bacterium]
GGPAFGSIVYLGFLRLLSRPTYVELEALWQTIARRLGSGPAVTRPEEVA